MRILFQVLDNLIAGGTAEYENIEQRIGSEAIAPMHGYTSALAHGIESLHYFLWSGFVRRYHLAIKIGRYSAHHVMRSGHYRNWLIYRVCMSKLYGDFADAWQPRLDYIRTEMIKL